MTSVTSKCCSYLYIRHLLSTYLFKIRNKCSQNDFFFIFAIILHKGMHTVPCFPNISDVTTLVFKKPISYDYRSGQWIRIAAKGLNVNEYHPFTLTSAPHEEYLSLHIRAVGPWTYLLRDLYNPDNLDEKTGYPSVSMHA